MLYARVLGIIDREVLCQNVAVHASLDSLLLRILARKHVEQKSSVLVKPATYTEL